MCKKFIVSNKHLSSLEMETLQAKFRKGSPNRHRIIWCREDRTLIVAAPYNKPIPDTIVTANRLAGIYKPDMWQAVSMPRVSA